MQQFGIHLNMQFKENYLQIHVPGNQDYKGQKFHIEGDYSLAAFFFVAVAILGGKITISGLKEKSYQGDRYILECLKKMGCNVIHSNQQVTLSKDPNQILQGLYIDLGNHPDLVMPLSIAALFAKNASKLTNIEHLKYKESNRLLILQKNLEIIGANVKVSNQTLKIKPKGLYHGGIIDPVNDHRIAMSFAIAGLRIPDISIMNPKCVSKSYPQFFNDLQKFYCSEVNENAKC
jgi:3-phosphoshikimate 1-carboxyvinyltransferase